MINILLFLLGVLKFILFILLFLLLFVIVIILIVYFVPIRYSAVVDTDDIIKYKIDNVFLDIKATWIIGIIKFNAAMENKKLNYQVLIFGKDMSFYLGIKDKFSKVFKRKPKIKKEVLESEKKNLEEKEIEQPKEEQSIQKDTIKTETSEAKQKKVKPTKEKEKKPKVKLADKIENLKAKYNNLKTKFDTYYYHKDKNAIIKALKKLIKKILKNLKPKVFKVDGELGLSNLALTGKIVGFSAGFAGYIGTNPFLVGNFKEEIIIVSGELAGKIKLSYIISPVIQFALHKPVFKIIKNYIFAK